jgi:hypothetical protein
MNFRHFWQVSEIYAFGIMNNTRPDVDVNELGPLVILFFITSCILVLRSIVAQNFRRMYEPLP